MIPLGVILALMVALILYGFYASQRRATLDEVKFKRDSVAGLYQTFIVKEAKTMMGLLDLLVEDERLVERWQKRDLAGLIKAGDPVYRQFNSKYRITHFYFIEPDGTVFMRLHSPERRGDRIERVTFQSAKRTARTSYGVELGPLGTFTLRVVAPVVRNGAVIGYMELGEEVAHLTDEVQAALGIELAALIDKKLVKREQWAQGRQVVGGVFVPWEKIPGYVVTGIARPELADVAGPVVESLFADHESQRLVQTDGSMLVLCSVPLKDAGQRTVGGLVLFIDETANLMALKRTSWTMITACLAVSALIFLYFYLRLGKEEAKVREEHLDDMLEQGRQRMAEQQHFIAEISLARDTIQLQSKFLRTILDAVPLPIYYKDAEGRYLGCNQSFERFFGKSRDEINGRSAVEVFGRDVVAEASAGDAFPDGEAPARIEAMLADKSGQLHDMMISKAAFDDDGNQRGGVVAAMFDLTDIKSARRELNESEERLRSIFDNARIGIIMVDGDGRFISANHSLCHLLAFSPSELSELAFGAITHPRDVVAGEAEWQKLRAGKVSRIDYETRLIGKDGRVVTVNVAANRIEGQEGGSGRFVALVMDLRDRLAAEEARDMLAKAVECADEAIIITDPLSRILYANPAFERVTGYDASEVMGRTPAMLKSGRHDKEFYGELWKKLNAGEVWRGTFTNRRKNGELFEEAAAISSVRDADGRIRYFVAVKRDITRERELEASLRHAQKMEAVGTLASGISHDFNNILHAISGLAQVALVGGQLKEREREYVELIMDTSARGADLVSRILTFSRQKEPERKVLDLNREIAEILKMISKAVPKDVVFDLALDADLPPVSAAPDQMHQILMNLSANAWDAMPGGGAIRIRTRCVAPTGEQLAELGPHAAEKYVELLVGDSGTGMEAATIERIFDPFFTTKPVGKGTGLGLATVYGIVKSHGGLVTCKSEPGKGTEFTLLFPALTERRAAERLVEARAAELKGGDETLLLVDDDASILRTTTELLESFGYRVLTAGSGENALEVLAAKRESVALVVMDLGMPGMGGRRCLAEILRLYPGTKVLIASGYDAAEELTCEGAAGYLRKPFRMKELVTEVRRIIGLGQTAAN